MKTIPSRRMVMRKLPIWLPLSILVLVALLAACAPSTNDNPPSQNETDTPVTEEPSTDVPATEPAAQPIPCNYDGETYTCEGLDGHQITIKGVSGDLVPYLLDISPERQQQLLELGKQSTETGCVFAIAGDLVFYDQEQNLVSDPTFESPITISYTFTDEDMDSFEACEITLMERGLIAEADTVQYLPVYFDNEFWRTFKKYDVVDRSVIITFSTWGDRPIGGGTQP
jgi:hypothetical protein